MCWVRAGGGRRELRGLATRGKEGERKEEWGEAIRDTVAFQGPSCLNPQRKKKKSDFINSTTHKSPQFESLFHCDWGFF